MKFCAIPPRKNVELSLKGDMLFCLGQQYVRDEEYRKFFLEAKKQGWHIILDNGVGDHGDTIDQKTLLEVAEELLPSEVIALDVLFDADATIENFLQFEQAWANDQLDQKGVKLFFCPQGKDLFDWMRAYQFGLQHDSVSVIGFSKLAIPHVFGGIKDDQGIMEARHRMFDTLNSAGLIQKDIHCLGAGDPREFAYYKDQPLMRSTDSCFSIWSAMNDIDWVAGDFTRVPTPKDYFDREVSEVQQTLVDTNIRFLKHYKDGR